MPNDIYLLHATYNNSIKDRKRKSVREYTYKTHLSKQLLIFPFSEAIQLNIPRFIRNKKTKYADLLRDGGLRILYSKQYLQDISS